MMPAPEAVASETPIRLEAAALAGRLPANLPARCPRSPLDPAGLLHRAFVGAAGQGATPEDTLVAWLMSLEVTADPAAAARHIVDARLEISQEAGTDLETPDAGTAHLLTLLEETARWPRDRLARARLGRKRRRQHRHRGAHSHH
ncbi:MAG: hypothetical protein R3316_10440 [Rhodovibrionaceae bacterium]|nr:hypothetical protein [Rhodovibrionaceae bacterium]